MVINYENSDEYTMFSNIKAGNVFIFNDIAYMRIDSDTLENKYAVNLEDGTILRFGEFVNVLPVRAALTIRRYADVDSDEYVD